MLKKFLIILLGSWLVWGSWYFALPEKDRQKAKAFIFETIGDKKVEIKKTAQEKIAEKLISENPEKTRQALMEELKKNMAEMKKTYGALSSSDATSGNSFAQDTATSSTRGENPLNKAKFGELIAESEKLIHKLEEKNESSSFTQKAAVKILNAILPSEEEKCPPNN